MAKHQERIEFIHLLRGFAPMLVLWAHIPTWWLVEADTHWRPFEWVQAHIMSPLHLYQSGGQLGVVMFFLISGFIISHVAQNESRTEFVVKRVLRIWPLMAVAILSMAAASYLSLHLTGMGITGHQPVSAWLYPPNLLLLNWLDPPMPYALSVTWTLVPEVVFYAMILVLLPHLKSRPIATTIALLAMGIAIHLMIWAVQAYHMHGALLGLPIFALGRACYLHWSGHTNPSYAVILGIAAIAGFAFLHFIFHQNSVDPLATTYVLAILIFIGSMKIRIPLIKPLKFLGDISYALYLFHMPVGILTVNIMVSAGSSLSTAFAAAWIASIATAWAVTKFIGDPIYKMTKPKASRTQAMDAVS